MKRSIIINLTVLLSVLFSASAIGQQRMLQVIKDNEVVAAIPLDEVEYMNVEKIFHAPTNISARETDGAISVTWNPVSTATAYNVYRSGNGESFAMLGTSTSNSFMDRSPLEGENYYRVQAIMPDGQSELSVSSNAVSYTIPVLESGIYLGVTGFNDQLYTFPISLLTTDNQSEYNRFIENLNTKSATILYYSVDQAINALKSSSYPDNLFNVAIVTFTDGNDWGSSMLDNSFNSDDEYMDYLHDRLLTEKVGDIPITAYSIGLRGSDVQTSIDYARFKSNLTKLATSYENAYEVSDMSEVSERFKAIAQELVERNIIQTLTLVTAGPADGTRIRFTFDNVTSGGSSNLYIEGTFNRSNLSLTNVVYKGMTSTSSSTVAGKQTGVYVKYVFDGVRTDSKIPISTNDVKLWKFDNSSRTWVMVSEFSMNEGSTIETIERSAAIMLLLDSSTSLSSDFVKLKINAKNFISTLLKQDTSNNTSGGSSSGSGSSGSGSGNSGNTGTTNNSGANVYNAHQYVDLGLPSGVKWATCNIGAVAPEDFGGYYAWGETTQKSSYYTDNSKWGSFSSSQLITKGVISNNVLTNQYDVANVLWGGNWRMPTYTELSELFAYSNIQWYRLGGSWGYLITSKNNGNHIFLPAGGCFGGASISYMGTIGFYWTSTFNVDGKAYAFGFGETSRMFYEFFMGGGCTIRPVFK